MDLVLRLAIAAAVILAAAGAAVLLKSYFSRALVPARFDLADANGAKGPLLVHFTSPYCYDCQVALPILEEASDEFGAPVAIIDAKTRPDLLAKYSVRSTPLILVVRPDGSISSWWDRSPSLVEVRAALESVAA